MELIKNILMGAWKVIAFLGVGIVRALDAWAESGGQGGNEVEVDDETIPGPRIYNHVTGQMDPGMTDMVEAYFPNNE